MDFIFTIGAWVVAVAGGIVTIAAAAKIITKWRRSWKIIKRAEFDRLRLIEAEHLKCEAEKERLRKLNSTIARDMQAQLDRMQQKSVDIEVDEEWDPRFPLKKNR